MEEKKVEIAFQNEDYLNNSALIIGKPQMRDLPWESSSNRL